MSSSKDAIHRGAVSLVPNSGIQFLDLGLALGELRVKRSFWDEEDAHAPPDEEGQKPIHLRCLYEGTDGDLEFWDEAGRQQRVDPEVSYSITQVRALEPFLGKWVPLPYFRVASRTHRGLTFDRGPANWARIRIVEQADPRKGITHLAVLAIDTSLLDHEQDEPYLAPTTSDSADTQEFALAANERDNAWFLNEIWVDDWLTQLLLDMRLAQSRGRLSTTDQQPGCRHLALYLTFLELLAQADMCPRIRLVDGVSALKGSLEPVAVDLVLDIGHSRTCGMLVENTPDSRPSLEASYVLQLRDLGHSEKRYGRPFSSSIEFARATFGNDAASRRSGRANAFSWPSVVRVGPEAERLAALARGTEGSTGLSSPKRYLWDERELQQGWRFNGASTTSERSEPPVSGRVMALVNERGDVLSRGGRGMPAARPRFSRSALFSFMLSELLLQAMTQINSVAARTERHNEDVPRRLRRIVLTLPPAMPVAEQARYRKRATAAVQLTWELLGRSDRPPTVITTLDEASCTQIVYLFDQITQRFRGDGTGYFELFGRQRTVPIVPPGGNQTPRPEQRQTFRIASIDIGGGTTDLMIITWHLEDNRLLVPVQDFREGFKVAGDDVVEAIVTGHVITAIVRHLEQHGLKEAQTLLLRLFKSVQRTVPEQQRRRQFVAQALLPVALGLLREYERWDPLHPEAAGSQPYSWFLSPDIRPDASVLAYLEAAVHEAGLVNFRLDDVRFPLDCQAIDRSVIGTLNDVLSNLCEVVHAHDCDVLLLSGRPSRFPGVLTTILASMPVTPDRVQPMHEYKVGDWYPYADANGYISDPKTTAAVGAMLWMLGEGQIEAFALSTGRLRMRSTARFIGQMERSGQILPEQVLFSALDLDQSNGRPQAAEKEFKLFAPIFLGFRQLGIARWPGTPLYAIEFGDPPNADRLARPLKVMLERAEVDPDGQRAEEEKETFRIASITDAEGGSLRLTDVVIRLQTLKSDEGYWLDTGRFDALDAALSTINVRET